MTRLQNIDILRILAALAVVLFHFTYRGHAADGLNPLVFPEIDWLTRYFYLGVSLFFMISGFVIAYSAEGRTASEFALSRVARIYPAFVVCITLSAAVIALGHTEIAVTLKQWLVGLLIYAPAFGQPYVDGSYWSIVLEVIFYAWVGLFLLRGIFQSWQLVILSAWLIIADMMQRFGLPVILSKLFIADYAGHFVLGIVSYRIFKAQGKIEIPNLLVGIAAMIGAVKGEVKMMQWNMEHFETQLYLIPMIVGLFGSLFLLNFAIYSRAWLTKSLSISLGALTYPLYLIHQNVGYVLLQHLTGLNRWLALALVIALVIGIAHIVCRYIEPVGRKWVLNIGKCLIRGRAEIKAA